MRLMKEATWGTLTGVLHLPRSFRRHPPAHVALAVLAGLSLWCLLVWQIWRSGPFRVDDAYITFSFSKNLATGHGPIYSNGVHVEGYSNFLWMVLNALPLAFAPDLDPFLSARLLTLPFTALLLLATYKLARVRVSPWWGFVTVLLLCLHTDIVWAFLSGLETLPYTALVTAAFACQVAPRLSLRRKLALPVMTAAALMRIDGFLPLGFLLAWELWETWLDRRRRPQSYLRRTLPWVTVWGLWFVWRWWYYGLPLPSTYYAKALFPILHPDAGWGYVQEKLKTTGVLVVMPFIALLAFRAARPVWMLLLFAAGHVAYVIRVGGDWMPFERFLLPIVPIFFVLSVWGVADLATRARARRRFRRVLQVAAVLVGLVALTSVAVRNNVPWGKPDDKKREHAFLAVENDAHVKRLQQAAELLDLVVAPGKRLVTDYAGAMAYFTHAYVIDMWGLCNATISTRGNSLGIQPMYGRTCHACYAELHPDYFHTEMPWLRERDAFVSYAAVVNAVWQLDSIGRYLDVPGTFRAGRITDLRVGKALFFLERRDGPAPPARNLPAWAVVDYPFGL